MQKISKDRLEEIKRIVPQPDDELPEISDDEFGKFRLAHEDHPEWFVVKPKKKRISLYIDVDVLEMLKAEGKGYQTRINSILRSELFGGNAR